jgi:CheY-like chemotaxis protein
MSSPTVLLVEDDANDRLILEHAFQRTAPGIQLRMAVDGEDAVDYLSGEGAYADREAHPLPDLVLLDLKLPRKSGLEVLEWIRETPALDGLPVFMLSSSQQRGDIDLAYALGANSYLVKEADLQVVRKVVTGIGVYAGIVSR